MILTLKFLSCSTVLGCVILEKTSKALSLKFFYFTFPPLPRHHHLKIINEITD